MDRNCWVASAERAELAAEHLQTLRDSGINLNFFDRAWEGFVSEHARAFNKIFHAKAIEPSAQIVARIRNERLHDPLLKYLRAARNDIEHGLQKVAIIQGESRPMRPDENSPIISMSIITKADDGTTHTVESSGKDMLVIDKFKNVLIPIASASDSIPVPVSHLGLAISDPTPYEVARLGLNYLKAQLIELRPYCL